MNVDGAAAFTVLMSDGGACTLCGCTVCLVVRVDPEKFVLRQHVFAAR